MAVSLIEKIARAVFRSNFHPDEDEALVATLWNEWPDDRRDAERAAQAALTAIMGQGDGVQEWECFCDAGYFDMWCVREVGERRFGHGYHVASKDEAEGLCDHLNQQARHRSTAAAAERARIVAWLRKQAKLGLTYLDKADNPNSERNYAAGVAAIERAADTIERGEV